jgi:hypothetical protein
VVGRFCGIGGQNCGMTENGVFMPIDFRHDVDQVLKNAKSQNKAVLLDFSAAPM